MFKFLSLFRRAPEQAGAQAGRRIRLSPTRKFVVEYLRYSAKVPSQPLMRICDFERVAELRKNSSVRIGWSAIFIKAFALMASRDPQLGRCFMSWPRHHLYEHPHQGCRIAVNRTLDGEECLFFYRIERPEDLSLVEIQKLIDHAQNAPVEEFPLFSRYQTFGRMPSLLRRIVWWLSMNTSGSWRASLTGTFGLTTVAALGSTSVHPPTLGNIVLTSGALTSEGTMRVTFVYDHRVHDGGTIAKAIKEFENVINTEILNDVNAYQEA